jgi:nucleoside-diphosphate-sugar epimerase
MKRPTRPGSNMPRRAPDISKIQRLIGYRPVLDLPEMLERVIAYERERGSDRRGPGRLRRSIDSQ